MTKLPVGTQNVMIRSLGLPPDLEECCKTISMFDNIQRMVVTAAKVMPSNDEDSKSKFRILINAAEMGFGVEKLSTSLNGYEIKSIVG
jgi:diacylglycerol kinase family enzyme